MKENKKKSGLLTGMVVGGAVGSVLSLLFSTKERRDQTKNVSKQVYEKGKNIAEGFLDKYKKK